MFGDGNATWNAACSASVQEHPGSASLPLPSIHCCSPAPWGRSEYTSPAAGGWVRAPQVGQERHPAASPPSGIDAIPVVPRVLRDTHQSTLNAGSSSCLPQTSKNCEAGAATGRCILRMCSRLGLESLVH